MNDYPIPTVRIWAVNAEGQVAAVRDGDFFRFPGGPLKGGESWEQAVKGRLGELGVSVGAFKFLGMAAPEEREGAWHLAADFRVEATGGGEAVLWDTPESLPAKMRVTLKKWRESPQ